jgi:hypothetical protein
VTFYEANSRHIFWVRYAGKCMHLSSAGDAPHKACC